MRYGTDNTTAERKMCARQVRRKKHLQTSGALTGTVMRLVFSFLAMLGIVIPPQPAEHMIPVPGSCCLWA